MINLIQQETKHKTIPIDDLENSKLWSVITEARTENDVNVAYFSPHAPEGQIYTKENLKKNMRLNYVLQFMF